MGIYISLKNIARKYRKKIILWVKLMKSKKTGWGFEFSQSEYTTKFKAGFDLLLLGLSLWLKGL